MDSESASFNCLELYKDNLTMTIVFSLRGCIGCFDELNLSSGIYDYALTAALRDSRFKPVQESEIKELSCTVSLLTDFEPCRDPFDWTLEKQRDPAGEQGRRTFKCAH